LFDQLGEARRVMHGNVRQYLAVQLAAIVTLGWAGTLD
jgi:hypothetical protein